MKRSLLLAVTLLITACCYAKEGDTIKVYFRLAAALPDASALHAIDSAIYYDILQPGKKIGIIGYADYLGSEESNVGLSIARAEHIKTYLVGMGIKESDIQMVTGKGEVERPGINSAEGYAADRRVDIVLGWVVVDTPKRQPEKKKQVVIDIQKVKKNETFVLDNILFHPGQHKVRDVSVPAIRALYYTLKENPKLKVRIEGHICCLPAGTTDGYDYDTQDYHLSLNRAKEIYDMMSERGISKDQMEYAGMGMAKPLVYPEANADDERKNRRVEIRILEK